MTAPEEDDPLIRALRALPLPETSHEERVHRQARAAFSEAFSRAPVHVRFAASFGRSAVPVALACFCGIYLLWAFTAAFAH
jgi:hypothetical protein